MDNGKKPFESFGSPSFDLGSYPSPRTKCVYASYPPKGAGRGLMSAQRLIVFEHESALGNAPAHKLFDLVSVAKTVGVTRSFSDYSVSVGDAPAAVKIVEKI